MKVLFLTIDSLNCHFLEAYGRTCGLPVRTPNLDAFARKAAVFTRNYVGSLPCMPARREFLAGIQEFLWRPWGPMEPYDQPVARLARRAGAVTQLITDHYHYFQHGSHGYYEDFHGWDLIRGHEFDAWKIAPRDLSAESLAQIARDPKEAQRLNFMNRAQYLRNVAQFQREEDFFAPKVFTAVNNWLDDARSYEKWFLYTDSFEVHEPFHVPQPYSSLYTDENPLDPALIHWPIYGRIDEGAGALTERQVAFVRAQYAGKLTMVDRWFGRMLDRIDDYNLWDDTMIIVTSDHGHFLGEHGWMGKPDSPSYDVLAHTPLFVWYPGGKYNGQRVEALTTAVDLYATMLDALEVETSHQHHSRSLLPLLQGKTAQHRDKLLYGYWGRMVNITDGETTYMRAPERAENVPLYTYSTMMMNVPLSFQPPVVHNEAEAGRFLPYLDAPCWRYSSPLRNLPNAQMSHLLFDTRHDPIQEYNLIGQHPEVEANMTQLLRQTLKEMQAPEEQFARFGL